MATPVVVVASGGIPVTTIETGTPMTVGANLTGVAVTIVASGGLPVRLIDDNGVTYVP